MDEVLIEAMDERVAVLTLNRPDSLNALDTTLMRQLVEGVRRAAEDDAVGCIVLTGAGRGFCAGGDVKAIGKASQARVASDEPARSNTEARTRWLRRSVEASRLLHEAPKPVIAMINGACAGGDIHEIGLLADIGDGGPGGGVGAGAAILPPRRRLEREAGRVQPRFNLVAQRDAAGTPGAVVHHHRVLAAALRVVEDQRGAELADRGG